MKNGEITLLVGSASVGKTTYIKENYSDNNKYLILGFDDIKLEVLKRYDLGFDDLWQHPPENATIEHTDDKLGPVVEKSYGYDKTKKYLEYPLLAKVNEEHDILLQQKVLEASQSYKHIIIDSTGMTIESRQSLAKKTSHKPSPFRAESSGDQF